MNTFLIVFFLTFVILRICVSISDHPGSNKSDVYTPTKIASRLLGIDVKHWHIGLLMVAFVVGTSHISSLTTFRTVLLPVGSSLFLDQLPFMFMEKETADLVYFKARGLAASFLAHLVLLLTVRAITLILRLSN